MPLGPNGLEILTQAELQALIEAAVLDALPGLDLSEGPEQQIIGVLSEQLAVVYELLQALYAAAYPDSATGVLLDQVAALTGTRRRPATRSRVVGTLTLEDATTVPAGSIVAVEGDPDAQFRTVAAVSNSTGSTDAFEVVMEALETGPVPAPAGTLTVIVTPVAGWISATNVSPATLGRPLAEDAELREQRLVELAGAGQSSYAAIRAAVARVAGVEEVAVYGNETLTTDGDGRPGKSFEVVVWDQSPAAADSDEIAQAVHDTKPAGIESHGVGSSGTATSETLEELAVSFTRATRLLVHVEAKVVLEPGTGPGWQAPAVDAIAARGAEYSVGDTAYSSQLICALLKVPGILAVTSLAIGLAAPPAGSTVAAAYNEIVRITAGDVTVTEV